MAVTPPGVPGSRFEQDVETIERNLELAPTRSPLAGSLLLAAGCVLGAFGLVLVYGGLGLIGTIVWGYNDSQPVVYLGFGGLQVLVGGVTFFIASLLGFRGVAASFPGVLSNRADGGRSPMTLALGTTLAVIALAMLAFAVAAGLATPSDTSNPGDATLVVAGSLAVSLLTGCCSVLSLRD